MMMGSSRLRTAAEAAGYAMVNPEDFVVRDDADSKEAMAEPEIIENRAIVPDKSSDKPKTSRTQRNWLSWDYFKLTGRATA